MLFLYNIVLFIDNTKQHKVDHYLQDNVIDLANYVRTCQ